MNVLIATTIPAWAARASDSRVAESWLLSLPAVLDFAQAGGHQVFVFVALETDGGDDPFTALEARLNEATDKSVTWRFSIDDRAERVGSANRLGRICTGRNLAIEYGYEV